MSAGESGGDTSADDSASTNDSTTNTDSGPGRREVAYRLFAGEFDDASLSYSESDEERAPNYVLTPTGLRVNRLFAVGVLTEVQRINTDTLRGRIADPTGAFVTYAGQYQPEAQAFLDRTEPPAFVAITGKARTFEPDDSDRVFTSVRPESLSEVTPDTRNRWIVSAAEHTLERIAVFAAARNTGLTGESLRTALSEAGVDHSIAAGIPRAIDHYGTTTAYLEAVRRLAVDALEVVAGERDEVRPLDIAPDEGSETTLGSLPEIDFALGDDRHESDSGSTAIDEVKSDSPSADPATSASVESTPTEPNPTGSTESKPTESTPTESTPGESTESKSTESTPGESDSSVGEPEPIPSDTSPAEATSATEPTPSSAPTDEPTTADDAGLATFEEPSDSVADTDVDTDTDAAPTTTDDTASTATEESGMYQLDDTEREELEAEFGSSFSSGNEIDPAGEADIDVPDVDELAEDAAERESEPAAGTADARPAKATESPLSADSTDSGSASDGDADLGSFSADFTGDDAPTTSKKDGGDALVDESTAEATETAATTDEDGVDVDLENAAVEKMVELDDGDGADRDNVVSTLVAAHGVEPDTVEEAIGDALMSGRCYEPTAGVLKPI